MCRHLAYLGPESSLTRLLAESERSLYRQSWAPRLQRHGTVNADGFGFGWYPVRTPDDAAQDGTGEPVEPARYRRTGPIWTDANFAELAAEIRSGAVLAAVRCATEGTSLDESAAAPFREGRWLFSHNGAVPNWTRLPTPGLDAADLLGLEARSDSAVLWAMVAQRLRRREPAAGALAAVVRDCADARPDARLNLLLTDGQTITATRYGDTLWYRAEPGQVLVASEPSDDADNWCEVPENSVLVATRAGVKIAQIRPTTTAIAATGARSAAAATRATDGRFSLVNALPADYHATTLHRDVSEGLTAQPKTLPPKWFYDDRGGELFDEITRLPEYYPTRAERQILTQRASEIAALTRACSLVELGSGSSSKTRLLLDALTAVGTLTCYAPIDVNAAALIAAGTALCRDYPGLRVAATVEDFEKSLPLPQEPGPRLLAFLGSTIGNFDTEQRAAFFRTLRYALSGDDTFLLGVDLVKDPGVLVRAYDDEQGVTALFNKNVLDVLNRELDADFDPGAFDHRAVWNAAEERIEMHLRSRAAQTVKIPALDMTVHFDPGEDLRTEISVKFRRDALTAELAAGGFIIRRWWTDPTARFALLWAVPDA